MITTGKLRELGWIGEEVSPDKVIYKKKGYIIIPINRVECSDDLGIINLENCVHDWVVKDSEGETVHIGHMNTDMLVKITKDIDDEL